MKPKHFPLVRRSLLAFALLAAIVATVAPARAQDDASNAFYAAREILRAGEYARAAKSFADVEKQYPDTEFAGRALYWQAFALQREGGKASLRAASDALERQLARYPEEARRGDSAELAVRIQSDLAALGDAQAAAKIARLADQIREGNGDGKALSDETRIAALNALMQMSPEKALPILRKILVEKPGSYSAELREKAVFIVSQHDGDGVGTSLELLTHVIQNDDSAQVREQAVFWLSQIDDPEAVDVLIRMVADTDEEAEIREKAIFSLSQIGGPRASQALRDVALDAKQPRTLREQAIFWISQSDDEAASTDFLVQLYRGTDDRELQDRTIFSISQLGGPRAAEFLLGIVRDAKESTENRKQALFWLGQMDAADEEAVLEVFRTIDDPEVQEQAIFVLSQMDSDRSVTALIEIARNAKDKEIREKAIFWLGQSDDARAAEFLAELISEEF